MSNGTLAENTIFNRVFDSASDTLMVSTNPGSGSTALVKYKEEDLITSSNLPSGSLYFPSADGELLGAYKSVSLVGNLNCASGVIFVKFEVTNTETPAASEWQQVFGYNAVNNQTLNFMSASSGVSNFVWYFDDLNTRSYRVKLEIGNPTNDVSIKMRKTT